MKLTHPDAWNTFAGGICAASNRNSYSARIADVGTYFIDPISAPSNTERHIGYQVQFCDDVGALALRGSSGLYRFLSADGESFHQATLMTLPVARRITQQHLESRFSRTHIDQTAE